MVILRWLVVAAASVLFGANITLATAQEMLEQTPHQLVTQLSSQVLQVVNDQKDVLDENPEAFYQAISDVLDSYIAFDYIAKGVMGRYAKEATAEQRTRFSQSFKNDMMNTYAKGMIAFSDNRLEVLPAAEELLNQNRVSVIQKVYAAESEHTVAYSMGKSKETNRWMLLNVVIDGINLGSTFRSQFSQAMQSKGDLDEVIASWSVKG